MNGAKKIILFTSSIVFLGLFSFPPWYQTNGQYVKQLGNHFVFRKPQAVPVECYLVGCVTAPASYFHVMLDWRSSTEELSTIVVVATMLLLLFRTQADGNFPSIAHPKTRLLFSVVVSLALPMSVSPVSLLGTYGLHVPFIFFSGEHNWFWGSVFFPIILSVYTSATYAMATGCVWIATRKHSESGAPI